MAEDKKIRVSADISQLRSLREEASSMYREIINFNEVTEKLNEKAISQLKEQLSLLKDRNNLEELFGELKRKNSFTNLSTAPQINPFSQGLEEVSQERTRTEVTTNKEEVTENVTNINRHVENIQENTSFLKRETTEKQTLPPESNEDLNVGKNRRSQISNSIGDESFSDKRELADVFTSAINSLGEKYVTGFDLESRILRTLIQKQNITNRALGSVVDILISIDENIAEGKREPSNNQPIISIPVPESKQEEPSNNQPRVIIREDRGPRQENLGWNRATNIGTRIISGVGAIAGQSPVSMAGSVISGLGGLVGEGLGMIPGVGGFLGGMTTAAANIIAGIFTASVEKAFAAQRRAVGWSQTMGISNSEAMGIAGREGSYAAEALGINIGEYIERRNSLLRSSGGRILGASEGDLSGRQEAQSLMAVERLYGLNPQSINNLQGAMRFARRDDEATDSSSSVIRIFEQTMKRLQIPFSEIASTMEENLSTFVKTADNVLSKAGDFDASKTAAVLASIRSITGAEGRQLERYQQALSGQSLSQDEVTQAFVLRAIQQAHPELTTYTGVMAQKERFETGQDPESMRTYLRFLEQMSGSEEMLKITLEKSFSNLGFQDIEELLSKGKELGGLSGLADELTEMVKSNQTRISSQNEEINRFEPTAAQKTVSAGEALMSAYENKMIEMAEKNFVPLLTQIKNSLDSFDLSSIKSALEVATDPKKLKEVTASTPILPGLIVEGWVLSLFNKLKED